MDFWAIDWEKVFIPSISPLEIVLRGTLIFVGIYVLMRFVLKRAVGAVGMADVLMIVMIADAAQNGMAAEYQSVTEGMLLVGTLICWNVFIDWLTFRFAWARRVLEPEPLKLIADGKVIRRNLRQELITFDDLLSELRKHGVDRFEHVRQAWMEADGNISVVPFEKYAPPTSTQHAAAAQQTVL